MSPLPEPGSPVSPLPSAAATPALSHARPAGGRTVWVLLPAALYLLDQVTKWWVVRALGEPGPTADQLTVVPGFFDLVSVANTGAAFGTFRDNNLFFVVLSAGALVVLGWLARTGAFAGSRWLRVGAALLVPGVLGNLTDRLCRGHVVDFLQFDLHLPGAHPWPSFNVADSCICVAAGCFLVGSFRERSSPAPRVPAPADDR